MAQEALFQNEQSNDPKQDRDAAWAYLERLRDPSCGAGVDEYEFCGGQAEPVFSGGSIFPRPDHRTLSIFKGGL
jgi:hypothetical protein